MIPLSKLLVTVKEEFSFKDSKQTMQQLVEIIKSVRQSRVEVNTPLSKAISIFIQAKDEDVKATLIENADYIDKFCHPSELIIDTDITILKSNDISCCSW